MKSSSALPGGSLKSKPTRSKTFGSSTTSVVLFLPAWSRCRNMAILAPRPEVFRINNSTPPSSLNYGFDRPAMLQNCVRMRQICLNNWTFANWGEDDTSGPPLPPGEGRGEGNLRWSRRMEKQYPHQFPLTLTLSRRERGPGVRNLQKSS